MARTAMTELQQQIEAVRREAFAAGYAAAMQAIRELTSRAAPEAGSRAAATPRRRGRGRGRARARQAAPAAAKAPAPRPRARAATAAAAQLPPRAPNPAGQRPAGRSAAPMRA